ncbi:MAG TPA: response regulator transcription factor [Povalibacter sp.]|uniref:response regulator transcription factor n=1 Tax=Povalibacter sp. TaxID=1962978 RepID=UPI002D0DBE02|nr:response regulator transcription factor [Povalibacter sp.]HMN44210.1 response regulator transcription factor [Povalibacter sp.]
MSVDFSSSPAQLKVLIADDDADLRALIGFTLHQAGFDVCTASDGPSALETFAAQRPDLVLLDVNMPPPNGLEVCSTIRTSSTVPIMMLSVRDQEDDLVAAIDAGADDYVRKPFSPRALIARVRALVRRGASLSPGTIETGNVHLDLDRHTLRIGTASPLSLTPLETKALQLLVTSPGRTVTAERLLNHVWGRATSRERRTLKQLIYRLRKKLEDDPASPRVLQTTPGAGYKLVTE